MPKWMPIRLLSDLDCQVVDFVGEAHATDWVYS